MSAVRFAIVSLLTIFLADCGTYVPEIQDPPGDKVGGQQLVNLIIYNVTCEVRDALDDIYNNPSHHVEHTFLDNWGVQITLSLQVEEKASASPSVNWTPLSPANALFNLAGGGTLSADATRIDKTNSYLTVAELRKLGRCKLQRPDGQLLLQSDLKLNEWLIDNVTASNTGGINFSTDTATGPFKQNVLSHEVKFDITSSGNVTPGWKLTRVSINQTGSFLAATRDRTNDVIMTLGPTTTTIAPKVMNGKPQFVRGKQVFVQSVGPSDQASFLHLSSEIGVAVTSGLKNSTLP